MASRGTTKRNIRIPQELWDAALEGASDEGTNVSAVVNEFLRDRYKNVMRRQKRRTVLREEGVA